VLPIWFFAVLLVVDIDPQEISVLSPSTGYVKAPRNTNVGTVFRAT